MIEFARVAVASRAFALAAIVGVAAAFDNRSALGVAVAVAGIAAIASYVSFVSAVPIHWIIASEATVASLVVVTAVPDSVVLLPYLVVLPLLTGLARGISGASLVIAGQLTAILVVTAAYGGLDGLRDRAELLAPWTLTIAGSGLLGAWAKKLGKSPAGTSMDENYESARRLLGQLRTLARRLSTGLDPVAIATQMLATVQARIPCDQSAVFSRTEGGLFAPLAYRGNGAREALDPEDSLIASCWAQGAAQTRLLSDREPGSTHMTVFPLRLGCDVVGVLVGHSGADVPKNSIDDLQVELDELSLRLATALAFDEVRSLVTADERQRLAREIHDGVAQEVASLGYAVDDISCATRDPGLVAALNQLRGELSRIVSELRLSIFDLRTEVADGPGLGSALSDYVRKVGTRSTLTVHLTLDEAPTRLSPGVETELFRIAQEAITNARKHSEAENLWVDCWVRPPSAVIKVRDDGKGIVGTRPDSFGLRIMRERAERIEASVRVDRYREAPGRPGTSVTIALGCGHQQAAEGMGAA